MMPRMAGGVTAGTHTASTLRLCASPRTGAGSFSAMPPRAGAAARPRDPWRVDGRG